MKHVNAAYILQTLVFMQKEDCDLIIVRVRSSTMARPMYPNISTSTGGLPMKEYEIVAKFYNACAGSSRPQTFFEEVEIGSTDDYVRMKHGRDFEMFKKEVLPDGRIVYSYDNSSVTYIYEFTELIE